MWQNFHPVFSARIRTHDLWNIASRPGRPTLISHLFTSKVFFPEFNLSLFPPPRDHSCTSALCYIPHGGINVYICAARTSPFVDICGRKWQEQERLFFALEIVFLLWQWFGTYQNSDHNSQMWSPSLVRLDLSRRKVAAISFLANIPTDNEDNTIKYDCLKVKSQNTHRWRKYHCTAGLHFDWFGFSSLTTHI